ncbi:MAG TPA: hypothetical protein VK131_13780, partial [Candidatus Acidoferrales bacterium]|nr:hypothetical protein [Candidatus Acidoferrales bacterium]
MQQARQILAGARPGDREAAGRALVVLESGTGGTQPEILADLVRDPPDVADAARRLQALEAELKDPADTPDPAAAAAALRRVLAQSRYAALFAAPNPIESALNWLIDRLAELLGAITSRLLLDYGYWPVYLVVILALAAIAWLVARGAFRRRHRATPSEPAAPVALADLFGLADRLAAAGDHAGALRALAAAVAAALGGELAWAASPLTVRELFSRALQPAALRP